jgi:hypothetical protein
MIYFIFARFAQDFVAGSIFFHRSSDRNHKAVYLVTSLPGVATDLPGDVTVHCDAVTIHIGNPVASFSSVSARSINVTLHRCKIRIIMSMSLFIVPVQAAVFFIVTLQENKDTVSCLLCLHPLRNIPDPIENDHRHRRASHPLTLNKEPLHPKIQAVKALLLSRNIDCNPKRYNR